MQTFPRTRTGCVLILNKLPCTDHVLKNSQLPILVVLSTFSTSYISFNSTNFQPNQLKNSTNSAHIQEIVLFIYKYLISYLVQTSPCAQELVQGVHIGRRAALRRGQGKRHPVHGSGGSEEAEQGQEAGEEACQVVRRIHGIRIAHQADSQIARSGSFQGR